MKQVLQSLRDGSVEVADVPAPGARRGELRIATRCTLISSGTERMMIEFGRGTWFQKGGTATGQARMVLAKVRTDGLAATWDAVRSKLDQPLPLGYCNVGRVLECGDGVQGFAADDRVVSNGKHAEGGRRAGEPLRRHPGLRARRTRGVHRGRGDRLAGNPTRATDARRGRRGDRSWPHRVADGADAARPWMSRARAGLRSREAGDGAALRRGGGDFSTGADPVFAAERMTRGRGVDAVIITAATRSNEPGRTRVP